MPDDEDILAEFREEPDQDVQPINVEFDDEENPLDLSEEQSLIEAETGDVPTQPEPAGFSPHPALSQDPHLDAHMRMEEKFEREFNEKTVKVTEEERRRFLRAALHGQRLWFDIEFPAMGAVVRVVPAPPHWSDTASQVIRSWQDAGKMDKGLNAWLDSFQLLHIWMQVDSVNGQLKPWFQARLEENENLTKARAMTALLSSEEPLDEVRQLNSASRYLLMSALRIAEIKHCICLDAMSDGSFFSDAGTN